MKIDSHNRYVLFEFQLDGRIIFPGTMLKIRGEKYPHMFSCILTSLSNDTAWFECIGDKGQVRHFHPDRIERVIGDKRSFWKNV